MLRHAFQAKQRDRSKVLARNKTGQAAVEFILIISVVVGVVVVFSQLFGERMKTFMRGMKTEITEDAVYGGKEKADGVATYYKSNSEGRVEGYNR